MMLINGQATTQVDALDRGLCYGDGLFETLAVTNGQPQLWQQHLRRLKAGCHRLGITMPAEALLRQETLSLCRQVAQGLKDQSHKNPDQPIQRGVIKIMLTRGQGGRGYRSGADVGCNRIIAWFDWPDYPHQPKAGISVRWCDTRLGMNPALAGIKHLNRLEQVLARNEWQDDNIAEGLMLDQQNHVIEGTMTNLFIVKDHQLLTAKLDQCGVAGIIRQLICDDVINHGLPVTERHIDKHDVLTADEVFVCNSLIGLWPVKRILDPQLSQEYDVGPVNRHISAALESYLRGDKLSTEY